MTNYSKTVSAGTRLYYFDIREGKNGNRYLSITEMNTRNHKRACLYIHPENLQKFLDAYEEAAANVTKS